MGAKKFRPDSKGPGAPYILGRSPPIFDKYEDEPNPVTVVGGPSAGGDVVSPTTHATKGQVLPISLGTGVFFIPGSSQHGPVFWGLFGGMVALLSLELGYILTWWVW